MKLKFCSFILCLLFAIGIFSSCHDCYTKDCRGGNFYVYFSGFDSTEIADSIYIIYYQPNTHFTQPVDTSMEHISFTPGQLPKGFISIDYDARLVIPGIKTIELSNFVLQPSSERLCDPSRNSTNDPYFCEIKSFVLDGVTITPSGNLKYDGFQHTTITK